MKLKLRRTTNGDPYSTHKDRRGLMFYIGGSLTYADGFEMAVDTLEGYELKPLAIIMNEDDYDDLIVGMASEGKSKTEKQEISFGSLIVSFAAIQPEHIWVPWEML